MKKPNPRRSRKQVDTHIALEPMPGMHPKILDEFQINRDHLQLIKSNTNLENRRIPDADFYKNKELPQLDLRGQFLEHFAETVPAESLDWIILGNVLCEVPHPAKEIKLLDSLLKPGGRVYFCEHVQAPVGTWRYYLQKLVARWWVRIADGCNCDRPSVETMKAVTDWEIEHWTFFEGIFPWNAQFELGLAVKKGRYRELLAAGSKD